MGVFDDGHMDAVVENLKSESSASSEHEQSQTSASFDAEKAAARAALFNVIPDDESQVDSAEIDTEPTGGALVKPTQNLEGILNGVGYICGDILKYENTAKAFEPELMRGISEKSVIVLNKSPWGQSVVKFLSADIKQDEMQLAFMCWTFGNALWAGYKLDYQLQEQAKKEAKKEKVEEVANAD